MLLELDGLFDEHENEVVRGIPSFYHYKCDGYDDRGWGCGYRTLQTLCSWVIDVKRDYSASTVPSIDEIQRILVRIEDKPVSFLESNQWIGTCEAAMVLSELYQVDCKILHISDGGQLAQYMDVISKHLRDFGSPIMMGGDADAASKCILAARSNNELLILDPHYAGGKPATIDQLRRSGHLRWYSVANDFVSSSFYNLCLPQVKKR